MTPAEAKQALDAAEARYWAEVERIAAEVREIHVVSFCQYHRVAYREGMGTWGFCGKAQEGHEDSAGEWVEEKRWSSNEPGDLPKPLADVLTLATVSPAIDLGNMIHDYIPTNYED